MVLIKVSNEKYNYYFSTKTKAAEFLGCKAGNIQYYINYGKEFKGWQIMLTDDPDILNKDIDAKID